MSSAATQFEIRGAGAAARIIAITGEITSGSEAALMDAYTRAGSVRAIVLDFSELDYMNSGGIGLLVTLLVRVRRNTQRLLAVGLSAHYRQIFELTRLDEAIGIHATEADALVDAGT